MRRRTKPDIAAMLDVLASSMSTRAIAAETRLSQSYIVNIRLGDRGPYSPVLPDGGGDHTTPPEDACQGGD